MFERASLKKLERFEREGRMTAGEAMDVARRVFSLAQTAGSEEVGGAANELHIEAAELWKNDRFEERRARAKEEEEDAAFEARLAEDLQREDEERRRAAEERWAALEYCTTGELEARIGRPHLRPFLRDRGYLEGGVGTWAPTAKALEEKVAKVEVRSRYSVIVWSKAFVEALQRELGSEGPTP
jgi:hypothetical protein